MTTPTPAQADEKALRRAVTRAMEGAGTLPAKDSVKLCPSDWHLICDLVLRPAPTAALRPEGDAVAPYCWVLPGDDTANADGWIDARVSQEGEFTKPLYEAPPAPAQVEAASLPAPDGVVVKPLEWIDQRYAPTGFSSFYTVSKSEFGGFDLIDPNRYALARHPTDEAARAAAQADYERRVRAALARPTPKPAGGVPSGHVEIAHDGFAGDIIGHYTTREGKRGVVVQQDGTRVVHVYGEKWLAASPAPADAAPASEREGA
jgi:hypothetical protein